MGEATRVYAYGWATDLRGLTPRLGRLDLSLVPSASCCCLLLFEAARLSASSFSSRCHVSQGKGRGMSGDDCAHGLRSVRCVCDAPPPPHPSSTHHPGPLHTAS